MARVVQERIVGYVPPQGAVLVPEEVVDVLRRNALARLATEEPIDATLPAIALQIYRMAGDPRTSLVSVAHLVARDPPLAGRLLQVANSALYHRARSVTSLEDAVLRLGLAAVRQLVIMPSLKGRILRCPEAQAIWERSTAAAVAARFLAALAGLQPDPAFLAGLLADAGRIVLLLELPAAPPDEAVDVLHAEIGERLLLRWGIEEAVARSVGCHHSPGSDRLAHLLLVADAVSAAAVDGAAFDPAEVPSVATLRLPRKPTTALVGRVPALVAELAL